MILGERAYGAPYGRMYDELEERESSADGVGAQREGGGRGEEAVHDVEGIRRQADQEEKLRSFLDGSDHPLDEDRAVEPARYRLAEESS